MGTGSRIREDGQLNEEEEEALLMEEEDAVERQRKHDSATAALDFDQFLRDDDEDDECGPKPAKIAKPTEKMTLKERLTLELAKRKKEAAEQPKPTPAQPKPVQKPTTVVENTADEDFVEGWDDYGEEEHVKSAFSEHSDKRAITKQASSPSLLQNCSLV